MSKVLQHRKIRNRCHKRLDLIRLQVTDKVPVNIIWQLASFLGNFIHIVLSKVPLASLVGSLQVLHTLGLTDGQEKAVVCKLTDSLSKPD